MKNFKGGSATINEDFDNLKNKLQKYSDQLYNILTKYHDKELRDLNDDEIKNLVEEAENFLKLTKEKENSIDGFGPSFASALLNAHLPNVFPILDKRGLNGACIEVKTDNAGQVVEIVNSYRALIKYYHDCLKADDEKSIASIDKELFSKELDDKYKPQAKRAKK
ncbi:MAG: hypothetical protein ABSB19_19260 [Methylomonas sp.]